MGGGGWVWAGGAGSLNTPWDKDMASLEWETETTPLHKESLAARPCGLSSEGSGGFDLSLNIFSGSSETPWLHSNATRAA